MGYLGRQPSIGRFAHLDDITSSFNSACTTFSLTQSAAALIPGAASNLIVSLGGVLQEPEVAYTVNGSSIIFSSAPANTQPFFGILLGDVLDVGAATSVSGSINVTSIGVGANVVINTSAVFVGNSTSNTVLTSGVVSTGNVSIVGVTSLQEVLEKITISATAATGTIAFDSLTQGVLYYTTNASANWTVNFRGNSTVSLNTVMATGQSLTIAFLVSQGATAYYASAHQVDGNAVTPKWQGGSAPTGGNASATDIYTYTIVKTGSAAFTVFASQTKFA